MTIHGAGTFQIKIQPQTREKEGDITIGQYSLKQEFYGDLEATSRVMTLAAGSGSRGSGAYMAISG
jgi:hypothetical protein